MNEFQERNEAEEEENDSFDNDEFNDRTRGNNEFKSKLSSIRMAPPTDGNNGTSNIESLSYNNQNIETAKIKESSF